MRYSSTMITGTVLRGKGSRKNPIGQDGNIMLCGVCGADDHFRAMCPRNASARKGSFFVCAHRARFDPCESHSACVGTARCARHDAGACALYW